MFSLPVDDEYFNSLTNTQWNYYDAMAAQEEESLRKRTTANIEYLASFINPESVNRIIEERRDKNSGGSGTHIRKDGSESVVSTTSDEEFGKFVSELVGGEEVPKFLKR